MRWGNRSPKNVVLHAPGGLFHGTLLPVPTISQRTARAHVGYALNGTLEAGYYRRLMSGVPVIVRTPSEGPDASPAARLILSTEAAEVTRDLRKPHCARSYVNPRSLISVVCPDRRISLFSKQIWCEQ